jgi:acetyl/propionyl-CoA carboxylase alpha subunit
MLETNACSLDNRNALIRHLIAMNPPKLLIANRGEIACRVIRAARTLGLPTVAVHSDADAELPHVALADEAVAIGPARSAESYLNVERILDAARTTGATLLHPGYGFLSENASFAERCRAEGIAFVGPSPEVIRLMGDKEHARQAALRAGVPVLPGSKKLATGDARAVAAAGSATGFPLLVKAAAGGGGIGMRRVTSADLLGAAVEATSGMALKAFGDGSVYLERMVQRARHVEIQVFGFGDGTAVHLFERDCSLQRRHQKVIEEAPAPNIPADVRIAIAAAAVKLAESCAYQGAGTIEFLYDTTSREFFFLEMNTRIQVEHPTTEMITGVDLVAAQLRLAMGERLNDALAQSRIRATGHAIEARVYAENPAKNFMPSPGPLTRFKVPQLADLRFETGYREGNRVTPFYDPMLMKVIAHGPTRQAAIDRLVAGLREVEVGGIVTNISYLLTVLCSADFVSADVYTGLLTDQHATLAGPAPTGTGGAPHRAGTASTGPSPAIG